MVDTSTITITDEGGSTDTTAASSGLTVNADDVTIDKTETVDKDTMTETVTGTETSAEVSTNTATPDTGDGGGEDDPNRKRVTPSYSANASSSTSSAFYGVKLNATTLGSISDCPLYKNTTDTYIGLEALGTASPGFSEYVNQNFEYGDGKYLVTHPTSYADKWNVCFTNAALYYSGLAANGLIVTKGSRPSFNGKYFEYTLDPVQALTVTVRRQASGLKITKALITCDTDGNETTSTFTYVHANTTFSDGIVPTKIIFEGQAGGGGGQGGTYWLADATHNGQGGGGGGYMAAVLDLYDLDNNNPYWKIHIYAGSDITWTGSGYGHDGGSIVVSRHTDDDESDEGTECFKISGGAGGGWSSSRPAGGTITSSYGENMHWWRLRAIAGGAGGLGYQAEDDERKGESIEGTTVYASATAANCTDNGLARKKITAKAGGSSALNAKEYWSGGGGASCLGRGGDGGYLDADNTWHNDPNNDDAIELPETGGGGGGGCGGSGPGGYATNGQEGGPAYIAIYY